MIDSSRMRRTQIPNFCHNKQRNFSLIADFKRERFQLIGSQVNWSLIGNDKLKWKLMNYIGVQE